MWQDNQGIDRIGELELGQRFRRLRDDLLGSVADAARKGQTRRVTRLAALAQDCETALDNISRLEAQAERTQTQMEANEESYETVDISEPPTGTGQKTKYERGDEARERFLRKLASLGVPLRRIKRKMFETVSGRTVGIAYGKEGGQPDHWFLGLSDTAIEIVVLLCETSTGDLLAFVLPPDFVSKFRHNLTVSGRQSKFHVKRSGGTYILQFRGQYEVSITEHLDQYKCLV